MLELIFKGIDCVEKHQYKTLNTLPVVIKKPLVYLYFTNQPSVFKYVKRTLNLLEKENLPSAEKEVLAIVLLWCEVTKGGLPHQRKRWRELNYPLYIHNKASATLFRSYEFDIPYASLIETLIETHGYIGQYLKGEIPFYENEPLLTASFEDLSFTDLLYSLNKCIIKALSPELWEDLRLSVFECVQHLFHGDLSELYTPFEKLKKLRKRPIRLGEDPNIYNRFAPNTITELITGHCLWYVEEALSFFSYENFVKLLLISYHLGRESHHISFLPILNLLLSNPYKKYLIENYLDKQCIEMLLKGEFNRYEHTWVLVDSRDGVCEIGFHFSLYSEKLIALYEEAKKNNHPHFQSIQTLLETIEESV